MEPRSARQHGPAPGCAALGVVPVPVPVSSPPPRRDTPGSVGHAGEAGSAASAAGPGAAARQSPPVLGWRGVLRAVTPPSWGGERRRAGERRWAMRTAGGAEGFRRGVPANCLWQGAGACWGTQGGSIPFSALSHFPDTTCTAPRSQSCWVHWGHRRPWEPLQGWRYHAAPWCSTPAEAVRSPAAAARGAAARWGSPRSVRLSCCHVRPARRKCQSGKIDFLRFAGLLLPSTTVFTNNLTLPRLLVL